MVNRVNHEVHKRHSQETRMLVRYLYYFCRGGKRCKGFLTGKQVAKITGVPVGSVERIARGYF